MSPLVELITAWDEFITDYPYAVSVDAFWNYYQFKPSPKNKAQKTAFSLARRIGRVAAIQRTCLRLAFKEIPEMEPEWYYFLYSINEEKKVRKTDAISITLLLEPTTGIDILNRMIKAGLLDEEQDVYDKRSRLLRLTPKGEATLKKAEKQVKIVTDLLFSPNLDEIWSHVDDCLAGTEHKLGSLLVEHRPKTLEEVIKLAKSPL